MAAVFRGASTDSVTESLVGHSMCYEQLFLPDKT